MKLPGDHDPFHQVINIKRYGVVGVKAFDDNEADDLRDQADADQNIKGLIAFADPAQAYQPCNEG